jgi:hypothetical protein
VAPKGQPPPPSRRWPAETSDQFGVTHPMGCGSSVAGTDHLYPCDVRHWTNEDCIRWAKSIDCETAIEPFKENDVKGEDLVRHLFLVTMFMYTVFHTCITNVFDQIEMQVSYLKSIEVSNIAQINVRPHFSWNGSLCFRGISPHYCQS